MIEHFTITEQGDLFVANGIDAVARWDGFSNEMEEAGLDAPISAPTVSSSGVGAIVGSYYAYVRYLDADGLVSDLSPISTVYEPSGATGTITDATNASPIVITSAAHGIPTGSTVKIAGVGGNTSANNTWVITVVDVNTFSLDDSHGTATYDGGGTWVSGVSSISYSSVPIAPSPKVARRQILRNTDGQATTFYVDVDTENLTGTTFSSTNTDSQLATQEAVPLLDEDGNIFANRHAKPPNIYPFIAQHQNRLFLAGQIEYRVGHVKTTFGSATVTGVGTDWKATMASRLLYVVGANKAYEISSVSESAQTLTLTEVYTGPTNLFAFYAIRPAPGYRRSVAFSEAGLPQSVPAINVFTVQDTGDEFTGLMQKGSFIFVLEKRHVHKFTYGVSPARDGAVFMSANRGCINNRCWITVDDQAFMLDELGVHSFGGNSDQHLSSTVQDLFRLDGNTRFRSDSESTYKINWYRSDTFFATIDRQRETIRWFVTIDGNIYPKHALAYQYRSQKWWIEEYPLPVGGGCSGEINHRPQEFYGMGHAKVVAAWYGTTDFVATTTGDVRGLATSATSFTLTDSTASFPTTGVVNTSLAIVRGTGKGQVRKIISATTTALTVEMPWLVTPDTTSVYQIGGIHWFYRSCWMRFAPNEDTKQRRFELSFSPTGEDALADLRFRNDIDGLEVQEQTESFAQGAGLATVRREVDVQVDLSYATGIVSKQLPGGKEFFSTGRRFMQWELEGHTNSDPVVLYEILLDGVMSNGGGQ